MTLKERLQAKETKLGYYLKTWVAYILFLISALGMCLDYVDAIPWAPMWLKVSILVAGVVSKTIGHLNVDKTQLPLSNGQP